MVTYNWIKKVWLSQLSIALSSKDKEKTIKVEEKGTNTDMLKTEEQIALLD